MIQLVSPDTTVKGRVTWCLEYARKVFHAPAVENTAWEGWLAAKYKHYDRNLPDVSVPLWFEYWGLLNGIYKNYGHVVDYVPGKGFYSAPYSTSTTVPYQEGTNTRAVLPSVEEVERIYHCRFVGWSEDISNVRVAKEGAPMETRPYNSGDAVNVAGAIGYPVEVMKGKADWNDAYYSSIQLEINRMKQQIAELQKTNCTPEERTYLDSLYKITKG